MPSDWNAHESWDRYYKSLVESPLQAVDSGSVQGFRFIGSALSRGKRVWFAGCGLEYTPWMYATCGCHVVATDASKVAIARQKQRTGLTLKQFFTDADEIELQLQEHFGINLLHSPQPEFRIHDFREPLSNTEVDLLINNCAYQGLDEDTMTAL